MMKLQKGFSIITAIFLLVVLAFLGAAMVTFSTAQHQSSAMDVMGARAYQAARSGMEWGVYQVTQGGGACAGLTNMPAMAGTLGGFAVVVTCAPSVAYDESDKATQTRVYTLTSTASQGALGTSTYIERRLEITIAL